jgi:rhamnogalacturonan endolyase
MAERDVLLHDDFTAYPLGPVPNSYSPWGEYHCRTDQGRLGPWVEATTHYSWRASGGIWRIAEDGGRRVMEATFHGERAHPMIVRESVQPPYRFEVEVRILSSAAPCGVVVGYRHSRDYYTVLIHGSRLTLVHRQHDRLEELARADVPQGFEEYRHVAVECAADGLRVCVDGEPLLEAAGLPVPAGPVGFLANAPARFADLRVFAEARERSPAAIAADRAGYPQPVLWKRIATPGFGTDRNLRFGDINGDGRLEIVLAQPRQYLGSGDYCEISALTAIDLEGNVLWQLGEADPRPHETTADLCFQLHDLDGDGRAELIYTRDFRLHIADGATGETLRSIPTPSTAPPRAPGGYPLSRIIGDCLYFTDRTGGGRRDSIVLKDRYHQAWVYDAELSLQWTHCCETGHYPTSYDVDGDGREELMLGYTLLSTDGEPLWHLEAIDHADSLVVWPSTRDGAPRIAVAGSDAGFFLLDGDGRTLRHHPIGHAQTICLAKLRPDLPGLQLMVNTYWGEPGVTLILDEEGAVLHEFEPMHYACLLQPANWTPDGTDVILLSTHPAEGGLIDGHGRRVVRFPDDGHPVLCSDVKDIDGDGVDEVLTWDHDSIWVYKPDPLPARSPETYPVRPPLYNDSNYRGQWSLAQT